MRQFGSHPRSAAPVALIVAAVATCLPSCADPMQQLDNRIDALLIDSSRDINAGHPVPRITVDQPPPASVRFSESPTSEWLDTRNPDAAALRFNAAQSPLPIGQEPPFTDDPLIDRDALDTRLDPEEAAQLETARIIARLDAYDDLPADALPLDLPAALAYAFANARDYRFAEEEYVLSGLRLLIERHLWGPRFFNDLSADIRASGDAGTYDSAIDLVNEFRVTQRLPYGGDVSARVLARATEDLHQRVSGEKTQSADLILAANVPLLRGAGLIAREDLIQRERDVIYAARSFERFRRSFIFSTTSSFLQLVVDQQAIDNQIAQVDSLQSLSERERSRFEAGKIDLNQAALAEQRFLAARDRLNSQRERYRLSVDRFKVDIGMPSQQPVRIVASSPGLPVPEVQLGEAVQQALAYRLDLQTQRDQIGDARRDVDNARNRTKADLDLDASVSIPTDPARDRAGLRFDGEETIFRAGVTYGLPLDREIERINLRQAQIGLERTLRDYDQFVDSLAVTVRSVVRDIDRARYSLQIQERGIENAEARRDSFASAPDRFTARDESEALQDLNQARNDYDAAYRDLQLAILRYLLETGQLRVDHDGFIKPLDGMTITPFTGSPRDLVE